MSQTYLDTFQTNLSVLSFSFQLQLNVQQSNLGLNVTLRLHLEASVRKRLLKGDATNQQWVLMAKSISWTLRPSSQNWTTTHLQPATRDFLDADHVERKEFIKLHNSIYHHLRKEFLVVVDQFGAHGCRSTLFQQLTMFLRIIFLCLFKVNTKFLTCKQVFQAKLLRKEFKGNLLWQQCRWCAVQLAEQLSVHCE